jgi:hypothetical protein
MSAVCLALTKKTRFQGALNYYDLESRCHRWATPAEAVFKETFWRTRIDLVPAALRDFEEHSTMDTKSQQELERAYEMRLMKSATRRRRAPVVAGGSSATNAAEALKGIAGAQREAVRAKKDSAERTKVVAAPAAVQKKPLPKAAVHTPPRPGFAVSRGLVAGGLAAVCLVGLGGFFWFAPSGGKHSVSGTVLLDNRPLGGVELFFHPRDRSSDPIRVTTSDGGSFHATDVPAGEYCVSLAAADGRIQVPPQYRSQDSTPFRIQLRRDRANLRMVASSRKPK